MSHITMTSEKMIHELAHANCIGRPESYKKAFEEAMKALVVLAKAEVSLAFQEDLAHLERLYRSK